MQILNFPASNQQGPVWPSCPWHVHNVTPVKDLEHLGTTTKDKLPIDERLHSTKPPLIGPMGHDQDTGCLISQHLLDHFVQ